MEAERATLSSQIGAVLGILEMILATILGIPSLPENPLKPSGPRGLRHDLPISTVVAMTFPRLPVIFGACLETKVHGLSSKGL